MFDVGRLEGTRHKARGVRYQVSGIRYQVSGMKNSHILPSSAAAEGGPGLGVIEGWMENWKV